MKRRGRAAIVFDAILDWSAFVAGIMVLLIVVIMTTNVMARYGLGFGGVGMFVESCAFLLFYITFLAAGPALRDDKHPRMSVVFNLLKPRAQAWLRAINSVIVAMVGLYLVFFSIKITLDYFSVGAISSTMIVLPKGVISGFIAVGGLVLVVQALIFAKEHFGRLRHGEKAPASIVGTEEGGTE